MRSFPDRVDGVAEPWKSHCESKRGTVLGIQRLAEHFQLQISSTSSSKRAQMSYVTQGIFAVGNEISGDGKRRSKEITHGKSPRAGSYHGGGVSSCIRGAQEVPHVSIGSF